MLILNGTPLIPVLPVAVLSFALAAAWWLVWGRMLPPASGVFAVAAALSLICGDVALAAPLVAAVASYFLSPAHSAMATGAGLLFSQLLLTAHAAHGSLPASAACMALASPAFLMPAVAWSALAAGASWALDQTWTAHQNGRNTPLLTAAYLLFPIAALGLRYLAQPMEIAGAPAVGTVAAAGLGCLSSIIVWICVYALGYRRETPEGDRS